MSFLRRRFNRLLAPPLAAALLLGAVLASGALAGPGDPVRSYGTGGVSRIGADTHLAGAAVQGDGKLVAAGTQGSGAGARLLVVRLTRRGSLDRGFGRNGKFVGPKLSKGAAIEVQSNGRIVVAGTVGSSSDSAMLALRLKRNGRLDRSFGGDGKVTALGRQAGAARALALGGRRIVLAGTALQKGSQDGFGRVAVARLKLNGARDRSFGSGGEAVLDFGRLSAADAVAIRRDGGIVLAGSQRNDLQTTLVLAARLTAAGRPDRSFSGDGLVVRQLAQGGSAYSAGSGLALAAKGRIVIAGAALDAKVGSNAFAWRLRSGGASDSSFGGDGTVFLPATSNRNQFAPSEPYPGAQDVVITRGRIVLAGYHDELGKKQLALWALRRSGAPDRGFGRKGRSVRDLGGDSAQLQGVATGGGGAIFGVGDVGHLIEPARGLAAKYRGLKR